jgi:F0F1-type ATP synthase assembly protein I
LPNPESVWQLKPWWCQPWSILLTGLVVVGVSWLLLHLWWVTAGVSIVIGAWWLLFLVLMPAAWKQEQASEGGG